MSKTIMRFSWLKKALLAFFRTRPIARHYRRLALFEALSPEVVDHKVAPPCDTASNAGGQIDANALIKTDLPSTAETRLRTNKICDR